MQLTTHHIYILHVRDPLFLISFSKLYLYGGYNGLMLGDIVQLHIPDCSLFNSSFTCALGGALNPSMYNADPSAFLHSFCRWSDNDGK